MAAKYDPQEFKNMLYNVHAVPSGKKVLDAFPTLKKYTEFTKALKGLDKNKIICYIFYCYDKQSPLQSIDNLFHKRYESALLAGFEAGSDKKFDEATEAALMCQNKDVNAMIVRFLRDQADDDFAYLSVLRDAFYAELPKVQKGDLDNSEKLDKIKKRIEVLVREISAGDDSRELTLELYEFMEKEKLNMRPEDVADTLQKGEKVFEDVEA